MKKVLLMTMSLVTLALAGCATESTLKVNELKTSDDGSYYREGAVIDACYIRAKKDVTVTMNGIQIKGCAITRKYSNLDEGTTSIFEVDCSKVPISHQTKCSQR